MQQQFSSNATAVQLDALNHESLCNYISLVDVVISLLPASFHSTVASASLQEKHLVTASYVDDSMSKLDEMAKSSGVTFLCEMGFMLEVVTLFGSGRPHDSNEDDQSNTCTRGEIKSFTSYCGGLPSPDAANNPMGYKFSWSPAGAIRSGHNPATYKHHGEIKHVDEFVI